MDTLHVKLFSIIFVSRGLLELAPVEDDGRARQSANNLEQYIRARLNFQARS
jgi:hypothetical protein